MRKFLLIIVLSAIIFDRFLPPKFFGFTGFTLTNIVVGFALLLSFFNLLIEKRLQNIQIPAIWTSIAFMLYVLLNLGITQLTGNTTQTLFDGLRVFKREVFQPFLLFILPFILSYNKEEARSNLILGVSVFVLLNAYFLFNPETYFKVAGNEYYARFSGILGSPNKNAYILAMLVPIEMYFIKKSQNKFFTFLFVLFLTISIIVIIISGSRGATLCLAIFFFSIIIKYRVKFAPLFITLIFVIVTICFLANTPLFKLAYSRFFRTFSPDINTVTSSRFLIWPAKISYFLKHLNLWILLFGFGLGTSPYLGTPFSVPVPCHDFYLKLLMEYGLMGILFAGAIGYSLFRFIKLHTYSDQDWAFSVILSILVLPIAWIFSTLISVQDIIALIVGLILAYSKFCLEDKK